MSNRVEITGEILPSQFEDRAANTTSQISRVDSSLLTSSIDLQLFDGFIAATSEALRTGEIVSHSYRCLAAQGGLFLGITGSTSLM